MAMDGDTLGTAIGKAFYDAIPTSVKNDMTAAARADTCNALIDNAKVIANCIVAHIKTNAQITVAAGIPVSTTGTAAAQTGATTSTGTATIA